MTYEPSQQDKDHLAKAEALWADGPRSFGVGVVPAALVKSYGIQYPGQKLPISRVLPLDTRPGNVVNREGHMVREHADGTTCDMMGRRIVATKQDIERAEGATGFKHE